MGRLNEQQLLVYLMAMRGLDVTRNLADHRRRDPNVLSGAVQEALPVMRRLLSFLRDHAGILHIRLLPRATPAIVLARMFSVHPEPNQRTLELLKRYVWRSILLLVTRALDERTLQRHGVTSIISDEEESTQRLLDSLRSLSSQYPAHFILPKRFDARTAATRIALLTLASLQPRHLSTEQRIDVRELIVAEEAQSFTRIISSHSIPSAIQASPGNRMLHPKSLLLDLLREHMSNVDHDSDVLRSHAISAEMARNLLQRDYSGFITMRHDFLQERARNLCDGRAAWSHSDRRWLIKFDSEKYSGLPENEYSMLEWARKAGFDVPACHLHQLTDVLDSPIQEYVSGGRVFAIKRYDRVEDKRIHQEDFAQVVGLYPKRKYDHVTYEVMAKLIHAICGRDDYNRFIRRLVFTIASGNHDAHLKNWSIIYDDGIRARLAPLYDQVATVAWPALSKELALKLASKKKLSEIDMSTFERLAKRTDVEIADVQSIVRDTLQQLANAWSDIGTKLPIWPSHRTALLQHWRRVPLLANSPLGDLARN